MRTMSATTDEFRRARDREVAPFARNRPTPARDGLSIIPTPLDDDGVEGRALVCAGDVLDGTWVQGRSAVVAPGETLQLDDAVIDSRFAWRVAVYAAADARPLFETPAAVVDRSLGWVVRLLCDAGALAAARGAPEHDDALLSIAWVARVTRETIHWHLARLRPHGDRPPHPASVAEAHPLLRDQVLDAAGAFGQQWVSEVLGPWGHLVSLRQTPGHAYVVRGHSELADYLRLRC